MKNWLWRVKCVGGPMVVGTCSWHGYRATGDWAKGETPEKRVHPDPCPRCGGSVLGVKPKLTHFYKWERFASE